MGRRKSKSQSKVLLPESCASAIARFKAAKDFQQQGYYTEAIAYALQTEGKLIKSNNKQSVYYIKLKFIEAKIYSDQLRTKPYKISLKFSILLCAVKSY